MANYCINMITLRGESKDLKKFKKGLEEKGFSDVAPVTKKDIEKVEYEVDAYRNKWGTKTDWDDYETNFLDTEVDKEGNIVGISLRFDTAWTPPCKWLKKASKKYRLESFLICWDEGFQFYGEIDYKNGKVEREYETDDMVDIIGRLYDLEGQEFVEDTFFYVFGEVIKKYELDEDFFYEYTDWELREAILLAYFQDEKELEKIVQQINADEEMNKLDYSEYMVVYFPPEYDPELRIIKEGKANKFFSAKNGWSEEEIAKIKAMKLNDKLDIYSLIVVKLKEAE